MGIKIRIQAVWIRPSVNKVRIHLKKLAICFTSGENKQFPMSVVIIRIDNRLFPTSKTRYIFPNMSSDNCTFTICFEKENWLFSSQLWNQPDSVSKQTVKVQLSLDVLGKVYRTTSEEEKDFRGAWSWYHEAEGLVLPFWRFSKISLFFTSCKYYFSLRVYGKLGIRRL